jgi:hypothetical protein
MIKETCSCGATFEIAEKWASDENLAAREWREKHHHEVKSEKWRHLNGRGPDTPVGTGLYVLNEDYVWGENGPVWISTKHSPPPFWYLSVGKPLNPRKAEYEEA